MFLVSFIPKYQENEVSFQLNEFARPVFSKNGVKLKIIDYLYSVCHTLVPIVSLSKLKFTRDIDIISATKRVWFSLKITCNGNPDPIKGPFTFTLGVFDARAKRDALARCLRCATRVWRASKIAHQARGRFQRSVPTQVGRLFSDVQQLDFCALFRQFCLAFKRDGGNFALIKRLSARLCDRSHDQSRGVKGSSDRARPRSTALGSTSQLNNATKRSRERPNRPVWRAPFNSMFRYPCVYAPRFARASNTPSVKGP